MAGRMAWAEAVLLDVHCVFHDQFLPVRDRTDPCPASPVSSHARRIRRRLAADGTGHLGRYLPSREAGASLCAVWNHGHLRSCDWPDAGRLDHRQLLLALDFLHQWSSWRLSTRTGLSACRRSTLYGPPEETAFRGRLHRIFLP